ncbi:DUF3429 domain-containing protein [Idiomarina piscisalsi]|uniref:DUF3429 domain-containing protein n=1 Tax=Idiomarina piscisalsi TaxID=1096243 RepID=A0ABN5AS72_9GAMM|nr:DUF3429 domain-containing protein [Idiomarina piscisalsi]ASG66781.1 DUF3429 domain-containing protein [Idiomarina piscisalsi]MTJ01723.1 DUF3429 domain-containing protein [Idiomarina piscisalsi]
MNTAKNKLIYTLGFLGLIPFIVSSLAELMQVGSILGFRPLNLLITYGAIILTFLGGVLWGRALHRAASEPTNALLILSNVFALLAWLTLLLNSSAWSLGLQMAGFAILLFFEQKLARSSAMTSYMGYYRIRLILTSAVIVCELLVFGNHIL